MTNAQVWLPGLVVVLLHWRWLRPRSPRLIQLGPGRRCAVQMPSGSVLEIGPQSRIGGFSADLVLRGADRARLLLLRDQLEPADWRLLRLAIGESD